MSDDPGAASNSNLNSAKPAPRTGLGRLGPALKHSFAGIRATLKTESAFRQEVCLFFLLVPAALWLGESNLERVALIIPLFLVLIVELLNTGLESVVDRLGFDYHELSKAAKDAGSAAVFLSLMLVLFSWAVILLIPG